MQFSQLEPEDTNKLNLDNLDTFEFIIKGYSIVSNYL